MRHAEDPNTQREREREQEIATMVTCFKEKGEKPVTPLSLLRNPKIKTISFPKIKIQNLDEKEVSNQRCQSHAISNSLTQWPPIHQTNSTSTLLLLQKKTLNKSQTTTLPLLLSRPPNRLEEEEEEEPTDEASDQPSVTTVDSKAKYGKDSKRTVAAAYSRGCC